MARDEKTRSMTDEDEAPKKQQYLVILELKYEETDEMRDKHSLGVFVELKGLFVLDVWLGRGSAGIVQSDSGSNIIIGQKID